MHIYLYVKTHVTTGLKYLGVTTSKNPYAYKGSGLYWRNHLKIHGNNFSTEILKECETKEDVKIWGQFYSDLWNIVESQEWANLRVEDGLGCIEMPTYAKNKASDTKKKNGTTQDNSEIISKALETKKKNGTLGKGQTKESIAKQHKTKLARYGTLNTITEESKAKISATKLAAKNKRSVTSIDKQKSTCAMRKNYHRSKEANEKMLATRLAKYGTTNMKSLPDRDKPTNPSL